MFCKQCGNEILENEIKCSKCNTKVGKGAVYCATCGKKTKECECYIENEAKEEVKQEIASSQNQKPVDIPKNIEEIVLPKSNIYTNVSQGRKVNNSSLFQKLLAQQQIEEQQSLEFSLQPSSKNSSDSKNMNTTKNQVEKKVDIKDEVELKNIKNDSETLKSEEKTKEPVKSQLIIPQNVDVLKDKSQKQDKIKEENNTETTESVIYPNKNKEESSNFNDAFKNVRNVTKIPQDTPPINKEIFNKGATEKCNISDYLGIASIFIGFQGNIISLIIGIILGLLGCFGNYKLKFGIAGIIVSIISFVMYLLTTYTAILTIFPF